MLAFVASIGIATAVAPQTGALGNEIGYQFSRQCGANSYPDKDYFPSLTGRNISFTTGGFCLMRNSYKAIFQPDGNFVVYNGNRAVWASNTWGKGATRLTFQSDGNLVIYAGYTPLWNTYTYNRMGASNPNFPTLVMQNDGNLVIYGPNGRTPYWSTWTGPIYY